MRAKSLLLSSIAATSSMTAFSYLCSGSEKKNFREPLLLASLLKKLCGYNGPKLKLEPFGWLIHYSMGALWSPVEYLYLKPNAEKKAIKEAVIFGLLGGVTGALIWHLSFKLAKHSPETNKGLFYSHLVMAHVVYSLALRQCIKDQVLKGPDTQIFACSKSCSE